LRDRLLDSFKGTNISVQLETVNFLEIQPLTEEQLPAIVELDKISLGGLWTLEGYKRELDSPSSHFLVLSGELAIGETNSSLLLGFGCFWSILEEAHITLLAIHPGYQGQGMGKLLLYYLMRLAKIQGMERATLEVRVSNGRALSLYQKFGFKEAGKRRRYYQDTGEDALILWQSGLQSPEFTGILREWHQEISDSLASHGWQEKPLAVNTEQ